MITKSERVNRWLVVGLAAATIASAGSFAVARVGGDDSDPVDRRTSTTVERGQDPRQPRLELLDGLDPRPSCPVLEGESAEPGRGEVLLEIGRAKDRCFVISTEVVADSDAERRLEELWEEPDVIAAQRSVEIVPARRRAERAAPVWSPRGPEDEQWGHDVLDAAKMRALWPADAPEVKVAVLDDGIDTRNRDLEGQVSGVTPWPADDSVGHGTSVASIIAARDDGEGVLGLTPRARLMDAHFTNTEEPHGVVWAVENGADVINFSYQTAEPAPLWVAELQYAERNGIVVVVGAGNCGDHETLKENNCRVGLNQPNNFVVETALSVGSIEPDGNISSYSTHNAQVDIVAPGGKMKASDQMVCTQPPCPSRPITTFSGTSAAAPHVAAAAALLRARQPDASPTSIREALTRSARTFPGQPYGHRDDAFGYGIVDPCAAAAYLDGVPTTTPGFECRADPGDATATPPSGIWPPPTAPDPFPPKGPTPSTTTEPSTSVTPPTSAPAPPPPTTTGPPTAETIDLSAAPVPSLCGHPAGKLVNGELRLERDPNGPDPGYVRLGEVVTVGDLDGEGRSEIGGVFHCSQGGVSWPDHLVVYREDLSIVGEVDTAEVFAATAVYRATIDAISYQDETFAVAVTVERTTTETGPGRYQARTFVVDVVNDKLVWK